MRNHPTQSIWFHFVLRRAIDFRYRFAQSLRICIAIALHSKNSTRYNSLINKQKINICAGLAELARKEQLPVSPALFDLEIIGPVRLFFKT
jgi:hypothetical protein